MTPGYTRPLTLRSWLLTSLAAPFLILVLFTALPGCSALDAYVRSAPAATRIAVQYAVLKTLEAHPHAPTRAAAVIAKVDEVRTWLRGGNGLASTDALAAAIRAKLDVQNLSPADQLLVDTLVVTIAYEIDQRTQAGLVPADRLVAVNDALDWIEQTARLFVQEGARQ